MDVPCRVVLKVAILPLDAEDGRQMMPVLSNEAGVLLLEKEEGITPKLLEEHWPNILESMQNRLPDVLDALSRIIIQLQKEEQERQHYHHLKHDFKSFAQMYGGNPLVDQPRALDDAEIHRMQMMWQEANRIRMQNPEREPLQAGNWGELDWLQRPHAEIYQAPPPPDVQFFPNVHAGPHFVHIPPEQIQQAGPLPPLPEPDPEARARHNREEEVWRLHGVPQPNDRVEPGEAPLEAELRAQRYNDQQEANIRAEIALMAQRQRERQEAARAREEEHIRLERRRMWARRNP